MERIVLLILVSSREKSALKVQELLSEFGCLIKTRLGLHETQAGCSDSGLIILELVPNPTPPPQELETRLNSLSGVSAKLVQMSLA